MKKLFYSFILFFSLTLQASHTPLPEWVILREMDTGNTYLIDDGFDCITWIDSYADGSWKIWHFGNCN